MNPKFLVSPLLSFLLSFSACGRRMKVCFECRRQIISKEGLCKCHMKRQQYNFPSIVETLHGIHGNTRYHGYWSMATHVTMDTDPWQHTLPRIPYSFFCFSFLAPDPTPAPAVTPTQSDQHLCTICVTYPRDTALSCGHQYCHECSKRFDHCPVCRKFVQNRIRLFDQ